MKARIFPTLALAAGLSAAFVILIGDTAAAVGETGKASWFSGGGLTASGEWNKADDLTAAHRSLPFGTRVRVENLRNGRSVVVRINDRGPRNRVISVSSAAADRLHMKGAGIVRVRLTVLDDDDPPEEAMPEAAAIEADVVEETAPPAESASLQSSIVGMQITLDAGIAARFEVGFQEESWEANELKRVIEAFVPRILAAQRGALPQTVPDTAISLPVAEEPWPIDGSSALGYAPASLSGQ